MTLFEHLAELRTRLVRAALALMAPMTLFHESSIVAAWFIERSRRKRHAAAATT